MFNATAPLAANTALLTKLSELWWNSAVTINARLWMMATTPWDSPRLQREMFDMVAEKQKAALDSFLAVQRRGALSAAKSVSRKQAEGYAHASLKPYHSKTRSNARRLTRLAPQAAGKR